MLGRAIRDFTRRDEVVLATKVWGPMRQGPNGRGLSRKAILSEVDNSLRRLGTDYIDLYIIHRYDYDTPLEETLEALNDVVRAGKVRYLGASSMHAWQFMKAIGIQRANGWAHVRLDAELLQPALSRRRARDAPPVRVGGHRRDAVVAAGARQAGASVGRRRDDRAREDRCVRQDAVREDDGHRQAGDRPDERDRAGRAACRPAQVAMAWLLRKPAVTSPIFGATKPQHLEDAIAAVSLTLSDEEMARLEELYQPHPATEGYS